MARSALGVACRRGIATEIAEARKDLAAAKAARLREDAAALDAGDVVAREGVRVIGYADLERPDRDHHRDLLDAQWRAARDLRATLPADADDWTKEDRQAWKELLATAQDAHAALGCDVTDPCRFARG